jgi:SAM-dependent methyltransferase
MDPCIICGNSDGNKYHRPREMFFGFHDEFTYRECSTCGCLHLVDLPQDFSKYYPDNYYSLRADSSLKRFLRRKWATYAYNGRGVLGWALSKVFFTHDAVLSVKRLRVSKDARILDVGCGDGKFLEELSWLSFTNLQGIDPFIAGDVVKDSGPRLHKAYLDKFEGEFDLIMLHHSYEHMENPFQAMRAVSRLLAQGGHVILRLPISSSYAWKRYGVNWINLDSPRHIFIPTPKSMAIIANDAGLRIDSVIYEGNDRQFWGSEQYACDIPLYSAKSLAPEVNLMSYLLSLRKIATYKKMAKRLNEKEEGDLACFYLGKA